MTPELLIGVTLLLSCLTVQSARYRPSSQRFPSYPFPQSQSPFSYPLQHKPFGSLLPFGDNCCPCSTCCACSPKQDKIPSFTDEVTIDPFTPLKPSSSNFDSLISSHPAPPPLIGEGSPVDSFIARPFGSPSPFQVFRPLRNKIRHPFHTLSPLRGERRMTMHSSGSIDSFPSSGSEYDSGGRSFDHASNSRTSDADKKEGLPSIHPPLEPIDNPPIIFASPSPSLLYPNVSLTLS